MRNKQGEPVLHIKVQRAIYGMLKSALLFYKKQQHDLEEYGFQINPYDHRAANKQIDGHQMTKFHIKSLKKSQN